MKISTFFIFAASICLFVVAFTIHWALGLLLVFILIGSFFKAIGH